MIGTLYQSLKSIKNRYYNVIKDRIKDYLEIHEYKSYLSYLRLNSISFNSLNNACGDLDINLLYNDLDEAIGPDKDTDLVLTYTNNLDVIVKMIEESL